MRRAIFWMLAAQALTAVLQFVAQVLAARLLSVAEVGIYFAALAVLGLLSLLQTTGLQAYVIRNEDLSAVAFRTASTLNAVVSGVTVFALLIVAVVLAGNGQTELATAIGGIAVVPIFGAVAFGPVAMMERDRRFRVIALVTAAAAVCTAAATIALLFLQVGYMSLILGQWAGAAFSAISFIAIGRQHFDMRPLLRGWRPIATFSAQSLAISGVSNLGGRLSDLAMLRIQGLAGLAFYTRATNLNGIIWNNIHLVLGRVMFANFAASHRAGDSLRLRYLAAVDVLTSILWPMFAGLAILAGPLVFNLYGQKWLPAVLPLQLIAVSSILQVSVTMTWELFTATGRMRLQTRIEFIRAIAGTVLFIAASFISIGAAAAARVCESLVTVVLYRRYINEMTETKTSDYGLTYARSALLTVVAVAPSTTVMTLHGWAPGSTPPFDLTVSVIIGIVLWAIAALLFQAPVATMLSGRVRLFRPRPSARQ